MFSLRSLTKTSREASTGDLNTSSMALALKYYTQRFDPMNGGFGSAPKFPTPVNLGFLLQLVTLKPKSLTSDAIFAAEQMVMNTLQKMALGGIHGKYCGISTKIDHVGCGFARYSVTKDWSLPHFEKMLYDQGQLLQVYLDGYLLSKSPLLLATVEDIARYLINDSLAHKEGGFYSAEDADSLPSHNSREKKGTVTFGLADGRGRILCLDPAGIRRYTRRRCRYCCRTLECETRRQCRPST
jgi:uncharacterized protein YyaL (SSP411 family)